MVLHNDKWKYKAKKAHERKHAVKAGNGKNVAKHGETDGMINDTHSDNENDNSSESDDITLEDNNNADPNGSNASNKYRKAKKLPNSWRYADPVVDDTILKDPEYIAKLNAIRDEEENRITYMRDTVSNKLKSSNKISADSVEEQYKKPEAIKGKGKIRSDDLTHWRYDGNSAQDGENELGDHYYDSEGDADFASVSNFNSKSTKPEIRTFTDKERNDFLKLQQRIKHQKQVAEMQKQMDSINNKNGSNKAKVLEVYSKKGRDNYKEAVDKRLNNSGPVVDTDELDDLVGEMLGVNLKTYQEKPEPIQRFDLDSLLNHNGSVSNNSSEKNTRLNNNKIPVVLDESDIDEFLDSVL